MGFTIRRDVSLCSEIKILNFTEIKSTLDLFKRYRQNKYTASSRIISLILIPTYMVHF
jgi:hypothetical protein